MKLGVDLDHTLIDYRELFRSLARDQEGWTDLGDLAGLAPRAIKSRILEADGGDDQRWQKLQALAYGPHILETTPAPGAIECLKWARINAIPVVVVSHKSTHSHWDPSIEFHSGARAWLDRHVDGLISEVFFEPSREDKLRRIRDLSPDYWIDDLAEVLESPDFPRQVRGIRHDPAEPQWRGHHEFLWAAHELIKLGLSGLCTQTRIGRGANSRVWRLLDSHGKSLAILKRYPSSGEGQLEREAAALELLSHQRELRTPRLLSTENTLRLSLLEDVASPSTPSQTPVQTMIHGFSILNSPALHSMAQARSIGWAAGASRCLGDYIDEPRARLEAIEKGAETLATPHRERFRRWLEQDFRPAFDRAAQTFADRCKTAGWELDQELELSNRVLSPSDWGPHNWVSSTHGAYAWVDWEYFGWDDPVKLFTDTLCSIAHSLTTTERQEVVFACAQTLPDPRAALSRLECALPLARLKWVLIALNRLSPTLKSRHASLSSSPPQWSNSELDHYLARGEQLLRQTAESR